MSWITERARAAAAEAQRRFAAAEAVVSEAAGAAAAGVASAASKATRDVPGAAQVSAKVDAALSRIEASAPHQAKLVAAAKNLPSRARAAVPVPSRALAAVAPLPMRVVSAVAPAPEKTDAPKGGEPAGLDVKQVARPGVMFVGGVGTGMVSGSLGLAGAAAQSGIDLAVDTHGTPQDKFCFGLGVMAAGAYHAAWGGGKLLAAGSAEVATVGGATPGAVPVALDGVAELGAGLSLIAGGAALVSHGAPPEIGPLEKSGITPAGYDDRHVVAGEIKYTPSGAPKAQGFHLEGAHADGKARIVKGTRTRPDARGVYKATVEVKDPRTGEWVRKRTQSTFFPESWDRQRVRREVLEAYANKTDMPDGAWTGTSRSGMKIEGFVDETGRITSAYPRTEP